VFPAPPSHPARTALSVARSSDARYSVPPQSPCSSCHPPGVRNARWLPSHRDSPLVVYPRPANTAGSGLGPWYLVKAKALSVGLSNASLKSLGFHHCSRKCRRNHLEPPYTDPYVRWCGRGWWVTTAPMPISRGTRSGPCRSQIESSACQPSRKFRWSDRDPHGRFA
jgi:hypothetical protein